MGRFSLYKRICSDFGYLNMYTIVFDISTYITEKSLIVVTIAMNALNKIDWFKNSVRDIRAFRIEDWSDFTPMFNVDCTPVGIPKKVDFY